MTRAKNISFVLKVIDYFRQSCQSMCLLYTVCTWGCINGPKRTDKQECRVIHWLFHTQITGWRHKRCLSTPLVLTSKAKQKRSTLNISRTTSQRLKIGTMKPCWKWQHIWRHDAAYVMFACINVLRFAAENIFPLIDCIHRKIPGALVTKVFRRQL